jgi:serine/threonine protein phosphatase PrpC
MYYYSTINDNLGSTSSIYHTANDNAFCIVIETNDHDIRAYDEEIGFHDLFIQTLHSLETNTSISDIPLNFANKLDLILRKSSRNVRQGESTQANYTGVALSKNHIYVCTAGFCRVHLIQNQHLVKVTRDHNFVDDLFDKDNLNFDLNVEKNSTAFFVPTRTLGIESPENKPPEAQIWEVEGNYKILMCSSRYHKFRNPDEYVKSFVEANPSDTVKNESNNEGFLAVIEKIG